MYENTPAKNQARQNIWDANLPGLLKTTGRIAILVGPDASDVDLLLKAGVDPARILAIDSNDDFIVNNQGRFPGVSFFSRRWQDVLLNGMRIEHLDFFACDLCGSLAAETVSDLYRFCRRYSGITNLAVCFLRAREASGRVATTGLFERSDFDARGVALSARIGLIPSVEYQYLGSGNSPMTYLLGRPVLMRAKHIPGYISVNAAAERRKIPSVDVRYASRTTHKPNVITAVKWADGWIEPPTSGKRAHGTLTTTKGGKIQGIVTLPDGRRKRLVAFPAGTSLEEAKARTAAAAKDLRQASANKPTAAQEKPISDLVDFTALAARTPEALALVHHLRIALAHAVNNADFETVQLIAGLLARKVG